VDGAHNLIFTADLSPLGTLENGKFLGSAKWKSTWRAVRDSAAALPPMTEVVWIKKDTPPLAFSFPGMDGQPVSLADSQFRDKVVIVEATGSWCPNCMDEALFLEGLYERYRNQGLRIIGLCFEDQTLEQSLPKMQRFASQTGAGYVFAYAGPRGGTALKDVLYVADGRLAYPTTLYIDRTGKIRRIETGFSGPGTGSHYTELTSDITGFVEKLLKEP
jgi:thiol-disulfide isomerase/thioredoxin